MPSARHHHEKEAQKYAKNAKATMTLNNIYQLPENRDGEFRLIVCEIMRINITSEACTMPMHQLAEEFITNSLNIGPAHPHRYNQVLARIKATMEYTVDAEVLKQSILLIVDLDHARLSKPACPLLPLLHVC
jgi:hypothetical protein